jgi:hypothetical protein
MVPVYLVPRLPDFLDDEEVGFGLHDPFDARLFMPGDHDEVVALVHDGRVAASWNLDRLKAGWAAALAVEGQATGYSMLLGAFLDPLVHISEDFLVARRSFSEVHRRDHHLFRSADATGRPVGCVLFA